MKIKRLEIDGLLGRSAPVNFDLSSDLVVLTGRNGAGKTSVLKLLWSIVSGNILVGLAEVPFHRARIVTDQYACTVHRLGRRTCKVDFETDGNSTTFEDVVDSDDDVVFNAEDGANERLEKIGHSVFFPTFRRIEGGFTISPSRASSAFVRQNRARNDLAESLATLSRTLTNGPHVFVSAISTADIVTLLLRKYADLSEESNRRQTQTSQDIIQRIKTRKTQGDESEQLETATAVLEAVEADIEKMEHARQTIMAPFDEVGGLVKRLFQQTGIKFRYLLNPGLLRLRGIFGSELSVRR
jgi:ABC-type cobalamin/Fe3+-siderophores transport system ATPase subunit